MATNLDRARLRGSNIVESYRGAGDDLDEPHKVQSVITDVLHYAAFRGMSVAALLSTVIHHYRQDLGA